MRIYFDNAATTPVLPEVMESMLPFLQEQFGNPSTQYSFGREARSAVEAARKTIASLLHASPGEIVFTSGGTESTNMVLFGAVRDLGVRRIITSLTEHHCVIHSVEALIKYHGIQVVYLPVDKKGNISLKQLEAYLTDDSLPTMVSLMHGNNEIGTLLDIESVGKLCKQYNSLFHSDSVQTFAHYNINTSHIPIDFLTGSAHKFHGPKGVGFLFIRKGIIIEPLLRGGGQEREMRAGTENVSGIAGMAKAAEMAYARLQEDALYIKGLKQRLYEKIMLVFPDTEINGPMLSEGLFTVLNMSFRPGKAGTLSLFALDLEGLCVSGGSACNSGASTGSHVIDALGNDPGRINIRFSFSRLNTPVEVDKAISILEKVLASVN